VRGYRKLISDVTGIADPAVVGALEEIMRVDHPTLDGLSRDTFDSEARIALRIYHAMDGATQAWYRGEARRVS
jgi:hypothetical protein